MSMYHIYVGHIQRKQSRKTVTIITETIDVLELVSL